MAPHGRGVCTSRRQLRHLQQNVGFWDDIQACMSSVAYVNGLPFFSGKTGILIGQRIQRRSGKGRGDSEKFVTCLVSESVYVPSDWGRVAVHRRIVSLWE